MEKLPNRALVTPTPGCFLSAEKLVFEDKGFDGPDMVFLSRDEAYTEGMRKAMYMVKRIQDHGLQDATDLYWFRR